MSEHTTGDLIPLHWEDDPEALYVRGHVTPEAFQAEVGAHYACGDGLRFGRYPVLQERPVHRWGRYVFGGSDEFGNPRRVLSTSATKSRGAFPLTAASVSWVVHARCGGWAGDEPCWIRQNHEGPHMDYDTWWGQRNACRDATAP